MIDRLQVLTEINLDDLVGAFGWKGHPHLSAIARRAFYGPARAFAQQMLEFDQNTGRHGLVEAARLAVRPHVRDVLVHGLENVPSGAVLVVSNHPGMTDTLVLFAALRRTDLRAIALARPFLLSLENVSRQLLYLDEDISGRVGVIRSATTHLRSGGALLSFPAGRNEPDPALDRRAVRALRAWVDSSALFVRLAPGTLVLPVCVRGVAWNVTARHPLVHLRKVADDRQLLAGVLQLLVQIALGVRPVTARVQIGAPIPVEDKRREASERLHRSLLAQMRQLMTMAPQGPGISAL